jgi:hypothetical protein
VSRLTFGSYIVVVSLPPSTPLWPGSLPDV